MAPPGRAMPEATPSSVQDCPSPEPDMVTVQFSGPGSEATAAST